MKIKEKVIEAKEAIVDFGCRHSEAISTAFSTAVLIGGSMFLYGFVKGVKSGRKTWDFSDQLYSEKKSCLMVDDDLEPLAVIPMAIAKEILDAHKTGNE